MIKVFFISLFLIAVGPTQAQQWTPVVTDVEGTVYSFDWSTLRKEGSLRRIWGIENYAERKPSNLLSDSTGVFSNRFRLEFDCKKESQKTLSYSSFSQKNAGGPSIQKFNLPSYPVDIAPDTVAWTLMEAVCKAK